MNKEKNKAYAHTITQIALIVAIMCAFAQLSIYIGPIPITMQSLIIAFAGYLLGAKRATIAVVVYLLLGAAGAPVFASFTGGFHFLISYTGGFLWGFIPYALMCGLFNGKKISILTGILGMLVCHLLGTAQYAIVSETNFFVALLVTSLPFIIKDVIFTIMAYFLASRVKKTIKLS